MLTTLVIGQHRKAERATRDTPFITSICCNRLDNEVEKEGNEDNFRAVLELIGRERENIFFKHQD